MRISVKHFNLMINCNEHVETKGEVLLLCHTAERRTHLHVFLMLCCNFEQSLYFVLLKVKEKTYTVYHDTSFAGKSC